MATNTLKAFFRGAVPTGLTTEYTVPASTTAVLKSFDICNTTATSITVRIHLVPSGGSADTSNALLYDYTIYAKDSGIFGWEGEEILLTGATIQISASAAGLAIHMNGIEQT